MVIEDPFVFNEGVFLFSALKIQLFHMNPSHGIKKNRPKEVCFFIAKGLSVHLVFLTNQPLQRCEFMLTVGLHNLWRILQDFHYGF